MFIHVLVVVNGAVMNSGVHVSFWIRVLSGYIRLPLEVEKRRHYPLEPPEAVSHSSTLTLAQ